MSINYTSSALSRSDKLLILKNHWKKKGNIPNGIWLKQKSLAEVETSPSSSSIDYEIREATRKFKDVSLIARQIPGKCNEVSELSNPFNSVTLLEPFSIESRALFVKASPNSKTDTKKSLTRWWSLFENSFLARKKIPK